MENIKDWFYRNRMIIIKAVALGLLPLLCCVVACALQGKSITDIYLPASEWNDELFYFKQVEAMLSHGYPRGYFGFNESHALKLSFAAWSPVLVWPWLVWGFIFGWNLMSPIICNIVVMMLAMVIFTVLAKPSWKQTGLLTLLFCTFTPFVNFMLRGMPEALCFAMVIIYYALFCRQQEKEDIPSLVLLFVLSIVMTLMRPYLVLFMIYPIMQLVRRTKWIGLVGSAILLSGTLAGYFAIKHYLGAEYFTPLFQTEWLAPFAEGEIFQGIKGVFSKLFTNGVRFGGYVKEGFISGLAEGAYFAGFMVMLVLFVVQAVVSYRKKETKRLAEYVYMAFCFAGMLVALLLMYKMKEGSKHLLTFMAMGVFVVAMMETKLYKKVVFLAVICVYLYSVKATSEMDYALPFAYPERVAQMEYWEEALNERLTLLETKEPSYENTVIWVFSDEVDYVPALTDWQVLYGLPEGFGVNCCYSDYALDNFDDLLSKYLTVPTGSRLQEMCVDAGYTVIGMDERVSMYEISKTYEQRKSEMHDEIAEREPNALFMSSIPLSYDLEEELMTYRGVNTVQGDFSAYSREEMYTALEEMLSIYAFEKLYLWLDIDMFYLENGISERLYSLLENTEGTFKEIMLYTPSVEELALMDEDARQYYYLVLEEVVSRLEGEDTVLFYLGDQEWFVGNDLNYRRADIIEREMSQYIAIKMFCDRRYVISSEELAEHVGATEELVQGYLKGENEYEQVDATLVFFGDSIFGNTRDSSSISEVVHYYTNASVYNMALGGISASGDSESMNGSKIVESFVTRDVTLLHPESSIYQELLRWIAYGEPKTEELIFFISYGLNDYMGGRELHGNDTTCYEGAMRNVVDTIKTAYPNAKIVLQTPSYISSFDYGEAVLNTEESVLLDYVDFVRVLAEEEDLYLLDAYEDLGVNADNAKDYLVDEVHHTEQGRMMYARLICEKLEEILYE